MIELRGNEMKHIKKILILIAVLFVGVYLTSCKTEKKPPVEDDPIVVVPETPDNPNPETPEEPEPETPVDPEPETPEDPEPETPDVKDYIDIYYINDFHGAILRDDNRIGLDYIGNLIDAKRKENKDIILLAGGDMLQGSALSNYFYGRSTIELMSMMGFDAMVVGNHEFDWGLEKVTQYFDGNESNGEATFPLLANNIFKKGTENLPDYILPYTILDKGGIKVGVIGTIGEGLESSITASRVRDYVFTDPIYRVQQSTRYLRDTEKVDFVIVVNHGDNESLDHQLTRLSGSERIDAVLNAHSHSSYERVVNGKPVMQTYGNGSNVGFMRLYKNGTHEMKKFSRYDALLQTPNQAMKEKIDGYLLEAEDLYKTVIQNDAAISKNKLSVWISELIKIKTGSDIAFHNTGGTRDSLSSYENLSMARLYDIFPFDNEIKTTYLYGYEIKRLISNGYLVHSTYSVELDDYTKYKVATNDYVFDYSGNPFLDGENSVETGLFLRELMHDELKLQAIIHTYFNVNNTIQTIITSNIIKHSHVLI